MRLRPMPRPNSATMIGKPMASKEPKLISRMIAATSRPIPSELKLLCSAPCSANPPISTRRPGWRDSLATAMRALALSTS